MAVIDHSRGLVVIGVVYDGPAEAGKTTTLRALAKTLGGTVFTPEEALGRTVYFDWLEYVGGRFDGYEIRCQIVSVPGQDAWAHRRYRLLDHADVVVFVGDTSPDGWDASLDRLRSLRTRLDGRPRPPVGVVFQANKRDLPGCVSLPEMRTQLGKGGWGVGIVESVARDGLGIREAFILGVRLALDRVRELQRSGELLAGSAEFEEAGALLATLKGAPRLDGSAPSMETPAISIVQPAAPPVRRIDGAPNPPSAEAPAGLIWPPVEGRLILHEAASEDMPARRSGNGDWFAGLGRSWRMHSAAGDVYREVEEGRAALLTWARQHAACTALLSPRRCLVLSETGDGHWRLWQMIRSERSLRELLFDETSGAPIGTVLERISEAARLLLEAEGKSRSGKIPLRSTLDTIGKSESDMAVYVALMAPPGEPDAPAPTSFAQLATELVGVAMTAGAESSARDWRRALDAQEASFTFMGGAALSQALRKALSR